MLCFRFYRDQLLLTAMVKCWNGTAAPVAALVTQDSEEVRVASSYAPSSSSFSAA